MILFAVFVLLIVTSLVLAWWKGGAPERIVSAMFLGAWLLTVALYAGMGARFRQTDAIGLTLNIMLAIGLFLVARSAKRGWPMLATSLQLMIVAAQVARRFRPDWIWQVYMILTTAAPYLQLMILIVGTLLHWRRETRRGPQPSWLSS